MISARAVLVLCLALLAGSAVPGVAYLVDGGQPQHAGVQVKANSSCVWAAEPFVLAADAYATSIGAAVARGIGPAGSGFEAWLYTIGSISHVPETPIAQTPLPLVPLNTQYVYYDTPLAEPVFLRAGDLYAVVLKPTDPTFIGSVSWSFKPGTYYGQGTPDDGKSWYMLAWPLAVRVDGYFVPEPGAFAGMLVGILGLATRRRRVN